MIKPSDLVRTTSWRSPIAATLIALKQYDRAITDYDQAIKLDPNEAIPLNNRGDVYYQIGQVDRAMDDFNAAIKLDPNYADALNNRGLAYLGRGAYDLAIKDFDQVLKLNPNDADAIRNRADALGKKSK
jgi:tetratricopeptide (TPR) repeat protein